MRFIEFRDIAQLVNFTKTTYINTAAEKGKEGRWALYGARHIVHTASYPFGVLYLNSAATVEDIKTALRETRDVEDRHIVYPQSVPQRVFSNPDIARLIKVSDKRWTARQYLISFIENEVKTYLAKIAEKTPRDYIDPHIETPRGIDFKTPNPVLSFLQDQQAEDSVGQLGIVLAEPGQGKTYMSQFLVSRLAEDRGLVPLMVDSSQWHSMSPEDQRSLEKTIAHSFRHFGAPIGWLEGHEADFLRLTLKADVLRVVFDGFDEYILRNGGALQPLDVLELLAKLAESTGARIVITSRTSFWEANYSNTEIEKFVERSGSLIFRIQPFDFEHAKNYFTQKLSPEQAERAIKIYASLRETNKEFVGRGFVLSLIADVATEPSTSTAASELRNPMRWITKALCRREELRQNLPLTADDQLSILRTFAVELAELSSPTTELLEISIQIVRPTLDAPTLKATVEKLRSHPLLSSDAVADRWKFKQDQISIFFLAEQIIIWEDDQVSRFLGKSRLLPEEWQDLGTMIVDIIVKRTPRNDAIDRLHRLIISMSSRFDKNLTELPIPGDGSRLASIVSLMTVEKLLERGSSHSERAELLLRLTGPDTVQRLHFSGIIARYDFRGLKFHRCRFDRITWANCKFDRMTEFTECQFVGGVPPRYTEGYGRARFSQCRLDPEAEAIVNSERIREGEKKYSRDDLRSDLHSVLGRFVSRGGIGLKTVEASTLAKGTISNSRYRDEILDMLGTTVLEKHHISGTAGGYHIRDDADEAVKFYAANNVFTGPLREAWERLKEKLEL